MVVRQDGAGLQVDLDVFQVDRNLAAMRQKMVTDTRVTTMQRKVIVNRSEAQSKGNKKHKSLQFIYLVSSFCKCSQNTYSFPRSDPLSIGNLSFFLTIMLMPLIVVKFSVS